MGRGSRWGTKRGEMGTPDWVGPGRGLGLALVLSMTSLVCQAGAVSGCAVVSGMGIFSLLGLEINRGKRLPPLMLMLHAQNTDKIYTLAPTLPVHPSSWHTQTSPNKPVMLRDLPLFTGLITEPLSVCLVQDTQDSHQPRAPQWHSRALHQLCCLSSLPPPERPLGPRLRRAEDLSRRGAAF